MGDRKKRKRHPPPGTTPPSNISPAAQAQARLLHDPNPRYATYVGPSPAYAGPSRSSDDLENIALVRIFLGRVRDRSADFVYGQPGAEFLPMHPVMEEEIGYYTELQEEWDSILPLYNHALAIHQGRLTRPYTQLTSPANITTQAPATTVTFSPSRDSWNWDAEVDELINEERMKCKMNETGVNAKQEESLTDSPVLKHDD